ncbi:MAG: hypothetical protein AAFU53_03715 [Cyanobacteria bacterium J06632_3]
MKPKNNQRAIDYLFDWRTEMLKKSTTAWLGAIAACLCLSSAANAVQIRLGDSDYDLTTVTGTYDDLRPTLSNNPWFNSRGTAAAASSQVPADFAFFTFEEFGASFDVGVIAGRTLTFIRRPNSTFFTAPVTFAVGTPVALEPEPEPTAVPEPASILGLLACGAVATKTLHRT